MHSKEIIKSGLTNYGQSGVRIETPKIVEAKQKDFINESGEIKFIFAKSTNKKLRYIPYWVMSKSNKISLILKCIDFGVLREVYFPLMYSKNKNNWQF